MKYRDFLFYTMVLVAFVGTSTQRPTESLPSSLIPVPSSSSPPPEQVCRCQLGSPRKSSLCRERSLDHRTAQGWGPGQADWSCLPDVVEQNQRVCYRATVYTCEDEETPEIKCALKRRNPVCGESNEITQDPTGQSLHMTSPRRHCSKHYRNREFCVYNVSMPQCKKGLRIRSMQADTELYEDASCSDYLEFDYPGGIGRDRICGTDIEDYEKYVTATSFLAVFWTDSENRNSGFDLFVACLDDPVDSGSGA